MLRDVFEDEYTGEKNALKVYRFDGKTINQKYLSNWTKANIISLYSFVKP